MYHTKMSLTNLTSEPSPNRILEHIFFVLFKRKYLILGTFGGTMFLLVFFTYLLTPKWESAVKLLVLKNPRQQMILFKDLSVPSINDVNSSANDLVELLKSNAFAFEIVKQYQLDERMKNKALNPQELRDKIKMFMVKIVMSPLTLATKLGILPEIEKNFLADAIEELVEDIEDIELEEGTSTINLTILAESSELSTGIANSLAQMLIDKIRQFERSEASETYAFVVDHLKAVQASLEQEEQRLLDFKMSGNIVNLEEEKSIYLKRWDQLSGELMNTEKNLCAMTAKLAQIEIQMASFPEKLVVSEVVGINQNREVLETNYYDLQIELADRQEMLKSKHPIIKGLKSKIELNREILESEPEQITRNETSQINPFYQEQKQKQLDTQLAIAELKSKQKSLTTFLEELSGVLGDLNRKAMNLERLNRSVIGLKDRYVNLRKKLLELEIQKFTLISEFDVKVSDPAYIPEGKDSDDPDWLLNMLVGGMLSFCLSIGMAFFSEYWNGSIQRPEELDEFVDIPMLGIVPPVSMLRLVKQIQAMHNNNG